MKLSSECQSPSVDLLHENGKQRTHRILDYLLERVLRLLSRFRRHELLIHLPQSETWVVSQIFNASMDHQVQQIHEEFSMLSQEQKSLHTHLLKPSVAL